MDASQTWKLLLLARAGPPDVAEELAAIKVKATSCHSFGKASAPQGLEALSPNTQT